MEGTATDVKQYDSRARGAWEIFSSRTKYFLFVNGMTGGRGMWHNAIFDVPSFSRVRTIKYRYYKILMIGLDEPIYTLKFPWICAMYPSELYCSINMMGIRWEIGNRLV